MPTICWPKSRHFSHILPLICWCSSQPVPKKYRKLTRSIQRSLWLPTICMILLSRSVTLRYIVRHLYRVSLHISCCKNSLFANLCCRSFIIQTCHPRDACPQKHLYHIHRQSFPWKLRLRIFIFLKVWTNSMKIKSNSWSIENTDNNVFGSRSRR